jgi:putative flippase GtrA
MITKSKINQLVQLTRISQFVSVGVTGAIIESVVIAILTIGIGSSPLVAKVIGAELSISTMFIINDKWTFATEGGVGYFSQIIRWVKSHFVRIGGLTVSFTVLYILINLTEYSIIIFEADFWPVVANMIGIGVGLVLNYIAESIRL